MLIRHLLSSASQSKALNRKNCASSPEQNHLSNRRRGQWHCYDQISPHWYRIIRRRRDGGSAGFRLRFAGVQNALEIAFSSWQMELYQDILNDSLFFLQEHALHDTPMDNCILCWIFGADTVRRCVCDILQPDFHCPAFDIQSRPWTGCQLHVQGQAPIWRVSPTCRKKYDLTGRKTPWEVPRQQVFLQTFPKDLLHRAIELHFQLPELLRMGDRRNDRSHYYHSDHILHIELSCPELIRL